MFNVANAGRWVGAAILTTFVFGMFSNFKLQTDFFAGDGWLANTAAHPYKVGLVIVIGLATSLLMIAIAITLRTCFGRSNPWLTLAYCALTIAGLAVAVTEYSTWFVFRTLSEQYLAAGADSGNLFPLLKKTVGALRNGIHFPHVLLSGLGVLTFFNLLLRERLVPTPLAIAGIVAALLQMVTVGLPLFGLNVIYALLAPLALAYAAAAAWLLFKGFAGDVQPAAAGPAAVSAAPQR